MPSVKGPLASVAIQMKLGHQLKGKRHPVVRLSRKDYAVVLSERTRRRAVAIARRKNGATDPATTIQSTIRKIRDEVAERVNKQPGIIDVMERAGQKEVRRAARREVQHATAEVVDLSDTTIVESLSNPFLVRCVREAVRRMEGVDELRRALAELDAQP